MKRTNQKLIYLRGQDFSQTSSKAQTYHVCDILNDWVFMVGVESLTVFLCLKRALVKQFLLIGFNEICIESPIYFQCKI